MNDTYKKIFRNTILNIYPLYLRNDILKETVRDGFVVNKRKNSNQMVINLNDSIDVSSLEDLQEKIKRITQENSVLGYIEGFEYKKLYRQFCYFKYSNFDELKITKLVNDNLVNVYDPKAKKIVDDFDKPTICVSSDLIYFKFPTKLTNDVEDNIKYSIICILDQEKSVIELRLDRIGISYKNTYSFYKNKINEVIKFLTEKLDLNIENIDFKSVIDYIKQEKNDVIIYAQKMNRNGTTAYLEAYDDDESVMPILGELNNFIQDNNDLFSSNEQTKLIREQLANFIKGIEIKSDLPMVKVKMDYKDIKYGVTHNYRDEEYSLFVLNGDLTGDKGRMDYVRQYIIGCYKELNKKISPEPLPAE